MVMPVKEAPASSRRSITGAVSCAGRGVLVEVGIAVADLAALDGEQVLHHEGEAGERP